MGNIVKKDKVILAGLNFFGDPFKASAEWTEENEIGYLWKRFTTFLHSLPPDTFSGSPSECFEIHSEPVDAHEKGFFDIFIGIEVANIDEVPEELLIKVIKPAYFIKYTLKGNAITAEPSLKDVDTELQEKCYKRDKNFSFLVYGKKYKGLDNLEDSEVDFFVPVKSL